MTSARSWDGYVLDYPRSVPISESHARFLNLPLQSVSKVFVRSIATTNSVGWTWRRDSSSGGRIIRVSSHFSIMQVVVKPVCERR